MIGLIGIANTSLMILIALWINDWGACAEGWGFICLK